MGRRKTKTNRRPSRTKRGLLGLLGIAGVASLLTWVLFVAFGGHEAEMRRDIPAVIEAQTITETWDPDPNDLDATPERYAIQWPRAFIFSINPGRSGSRYLANLIGSTADAWSFHEPFSCHVLRDIGRWNDTLARRRREVLPPLWQMLSGMPPTARTYSLTCPNFKTKLWDVMMQAILAACPACPIKVVVLRRYLPAVTRSLANIGWSAEPDPRSCLWCRTSNWVNSFVRAPASDKKMTQLERLTSYVVSTEAFAQEFAGRFKELPNVEIIEVRTEELFTDSDVAFQLLARLGLTPTNLTRAVASGAVLDKFCQDGKFAPKKTVTLNEAEAAARKYLMACAAKGIQMPPHLEETMTPFPGFDYNAARTCPPRTAEDHLLIRDHLGG